MLHEDGVTASNVLGQLYTAKIHKRIIPKHDVCINRENPNRKLPNSRALVTGFDPGARFGGVINHGFTHGYWTMNAGGPDPFDGAGAKKDYVSRILLEFDLDDAGITNGDFIEDARLTLTYYRSKSIQGGKEFVFDFHRFHPGLTGNTGDDFGRNDNKFTENATWWEYDHSASATMDTGQTWGQLLYNGVSGATGTFALTDGASHGASRWEFQGLGATGSTAEHLAVGHGATGWVDYSGGPVGSDQDTYADTVYELGFTASSTNVQAGKQLVVDVRTPVNDALSYYNNKVRIMIKLRNDEAFDGTTDRAYLTFYSSEAEGGLTTVNVLRDAKYSPALHITYLR